MGRKKHKYPWRLKSSCHPKHSKRCGALCCGSRLSVSSTSSSDCEQLHSMSNFMHAMVQARLEQMINERRAAAREAQRRRSRSFDAGPGRCIILVAMDKASCDPRQDFTESIMEVITSKGLMEPKELRSLLNCYISMNPRENHRAILEAFHEVCCSLFS